LRGAHRPDSQERRESCESGRAQWLLAKSDTAVAGYAAGVCAWLFWLTGDSPPISSFLS